MNMRVLHQMWQSTLILLNMMSKFKIPFSIKSVGKRFRSLMWNLCLKYTIHTCLYKAARISEKSSFKLLLASCILKKHTRFVCLRIRRKCFSYFNSYLLNKNRSTSSIQLKYFKQFSLNFANNAKANEYACNI